MCSLHMNMYEPTLGHHRKMKYREPGKYTLSLTEKCEFQGHPRSVVAHNHPGTFTLSFIHNTTNIYKEKILFSGIQMESDSGPPIESPGRRAGF